MSKSHQNKLHDILALRPEYKELEGHWDKQQ